MKLTDRLPSLRPWLLLAIGVIVAACKNGSGSTY
jgi:hypothetical protein